MNKTSLALYFLLLSSWRPGSSQHSDDPAGATYLAPGTWQKEMLDEVNQLRKAGCRCGRKYMPPALPLRWNNRLERACQLHAQDMDKNNFMGHQGSDGSGTGERAAKAHYNWQSVGENVSWNYDTPADAMIGWKTSPGHCRNMMSAEYKDMGAARQGNYYVQLFGRQWK